VWSFLDARQFPSYTLSFHQNIVRASPLTATLVPLTVSVANKELTVRLNPLDATFTKNRGEGGVAMVTASIPSGRCWMPEGLFAVDPLSVTVKSRAHRNLWSFFG